MRVHDAMSIEAAEGANRENRKNSKFLRICSLFYTIIGIGIVRWGDQCFTKITIVLRLIQMYFFYTIASIGFERLIRLANSSNNAYPIFFVYSNMAIVILTQYLLLLQGFFGKNNIERHADDIEKIDKKFPELSLAHQSKVHYYMHSGGLVTIGVILFIFKITHFLEGDFAVVILGLLWSNILIIISIILFYNSVYDVRQRFQRINVLCTDMGNQEAAVPLDKIRLIRKLKILHIQLSKRVLEIVKVHRITAVLTVIRIFTIFSVNLIFCMRSGFAAHGNIIFFSLAMMEILLFLLICMECTNVAIEARGTSHCVYGMALKDPIVGLRMEVLNFMSYLRVRKVQFNPYGCIEINNRLIVLILTVLITHVAFFLDWDES